MVDPRLRRRLRRREEQSEESEDSEEPDETDQDNQPDSSIEDLVQPADPSQFDRTFLAGDADLNIEGPYDPVAGQRQVIPRVAYVLSYQLVYNEERERWEPETGNANRGTGNQATVLTDVPNQTYPGQFRDTVVNFQKVGLDQLDAADLSGNRVQVQATGTYRLSAQLSLLHNTTPGDVQLIITKNGTRVATNRRTVVTGGDQIETLTLSRPVELDAGDSIRLVVEPLEPNSAESVGAQDEHFMAVTRLS
jgi:hypothetical protein